MIWIYMIVGAFNLLIGIGLLVNLKRAGGKILLSREELNSFKKAGLPISQQGLAWFMVISGAAVLVAVLFS